jgi:hypothetical protein
MGFGSYNQPKFTLDLSQKTGSTQVGTYIHRKPRIETSIFENASVIASAETYAGFAG